MRKRWISGAVLLAVATMADATPPATADEFSPELLLAQIEAQNNARLTQGRLLAASGEPRKLYAASLLAPVQMNLSNKRMTRSDVADAWLARAIEAGSNDPLIAAAAVQRCIDQDNCAIDTALATLQRDASDDAGQQLLLMRLAEHRKDAAGAAQAWQRATKAPHYGDQLAQLVGLLEEATRGMQWPQSDPARAAEWEKNNTGSYAEQERIVSVFSIAATLWQPELKQVMTACPKEKLDAARAEECRRLFTVMADSPSLLIAQVGTQRMLELSEAAPAQQQWTARARELAWISERAMEVLAANDPSATPKLSPVEYARWIAEQGELPAMRRLLAARSIALQPPTDWQPAQRS